MGRIRESMARLTPEFSATRAIREYTESHYLPAASKYHERVADDSRLGLGLLHWRQESDRHWSTVSFGRVRVETHDGQHFFQVEVFPGDLSPDQLTVELYADSAQGRQPVLEGMIAPDPAQIRRRVNLFCPDIRNASCERLHCAHHPSPSQRLSAARSAADPLAALIDKADREIRVIYPCSRTSTVASVADRRKKWNCIQKRLTGRLITDCEHVTPREHVTLRSVATKQILLDPEPATSLVNSRQRVRARLFRIDRTPPAHNLG